MSIAVPLYGFGASGGGTGGTLTVTAPANVTITVSKDGKTKTKNSGTSGVVVFKGLSSGMWTVTITGDGKTAQKNVVITTDYSTAISFSTIPEFTYTGDYEIVNERICTRADNYSEPCGHRLDNFEHPILLLLAVGHHHIAEARRK